MKTMNWKRWLALLLAALLLPAALSEEITPDDALPFEEPVVRELGEVLIEDDGADSAPAEPAVAEPAPDAAVADDAAPAEVAQNAAVADGTASAETAPDAVSANDATNADVPQESTSNGDTVPADSAQDTAPTADTAPVEDTATAEAPQELAFEPLEADPDAAVLAPEPLVEADPDAMVSAPSDPVLSVGSLTLGVKEKATLTLANGASPEAVGAYLASSDQNIATVDAAGVVTGKKVGTATVVMDVGGIQSQCAVTVMAAPKKVTLSAKKLSMGVGEAVTLGIALSDGSASALTITSDKPGVATVDGNTIIATGAGKATITVSTYNKKRAKCKVTVLGAPSYITANVGALTMWQGRSFEIEPILSPGSGGSVGIASSDSGVVALSGMTARAVGIGSATITLWTYNGHSVDIPVQVTKAPVYRALLVGESNFPGTTLAQLPGDKNVALMHRMLSSVCGPAGSGWIINAGYDLTAPQIHDAIRSAFAGAEEGDVSLFYISTHGDHDQDINGYYYDFAGCLNTYPDTRYSNWYDRNALRLPALASWLYEVPGQVVVIIDACGSGAAIYGAQGVSAPPLSGEGTDNVAVIEPRAFSPEDFDAAVVEAFRSLDAGVLAPGQGDFVVENKFFVLTSTAYRELGWALPNKYTYFTKWLTDSVKTKGRMPADANKNHFTTLNELYAKIAQKSAKKKFKYEGRKYTQHVQVFPANSGFELFYR